MTKIVYNTCYGGFSLSPMAIFRYVEIKGIVLYVEKSRFGSQIYWTVPPDQRPASMDNRTWNNAPTQVREAFNAAYNKLTFLDRNISRTDLALVQVVEELGEAANGIYAQLAIVEISAGLKYRIDEYDGLESVMTPDDYQWEIA